MRAVFRQTSLEHHLLKIPVAERRVEIAARAQPNDLSFEKTPFEGGLYFHTISHLVIHFYQMSLLFATQPYEQLETIQIILQAIVEIKGTWYNQATDFSFI